MKNFHFPYKWYLKDGYPNKNGYKVFSCFACGGGSTMGYKLAGYDVIGFNEIDPKMAKCYIENHNPKYQFIESIQDFKNRKDLPKELFSLDILDGSPPCSSFSMAGNRDKDWGKNKKFREGQQKQILDTLFFDFIDLAERLQPKVVISENVPGILMGGAIKYVSKIYSEFKKVGYYTFHKTLDASKMGVPQKRKRVFFFSIRKDLIKYIKTIDLFNEMPKIDLIFNEKPILFCEISDEKDIKQNLTETYLKYWNETIPGGTIGKFGTYKKLDYNRVCFTIPASNKHYHPRYKREINNKEILKIGTFPQDYNSLNCQLGYLIGMSVPPVCVAHIGLCIKNQWLDKFITKEK